MNINQFFGSALRAEDIPEGKQVTVVIENVTLDKFDDGTQKPLVHFQAKEKGLHLNVTNKNSIVDLYGPETDHWIGRPLVIMRTTANFQGKIVPALRINENAVRQLLAVTPGQPAHGGVPMPAPAPVQQPYQPQPQPLAGDLRPLPAALPRGADSWDPGGEVKSTVQDDDDEIPF